MNNKEAIKELEVALDLKDTHGVWSRIEQVLVLLKDNPCSACRGSGEVPKKYQSCGCIICTCEDDKQCQSCGAKYCDKHNNYGNRLIPETEPCPRGCKPAEPKPNAFVEELRILSASRSVDTLTRTKLLKAADLIEEQIKQIEYWKAINKLAEKFALEQAQQITELQAKPRSETIKKFGEYQDVVHSILHFLQDEGLVKGTGDTCQDIKQKLFAYIEELQEKLKEAEAKKDQCG